MALTYALPIAATAVVALALAGTALRWHKHMRRRGLSRRERRTVAACADALLPPGGALPWSATQTGVVDYFAALVFEVPTRQRLLLRLLLIWLEYEPWLALRPRLTRQSAISRQRRLADWQASAIYLVRAAFTSLRTLITMGYLANPAVLARVGAKPNPTPFAPVPHEPT